MASALLLVFIFVVTFLVYRYLKNKRFNGFLSKLPSPPGTPILGHISKFRKLDGLMEMITNYLEKYDGIVLLRPGPTVNYFAVADHKLTEYLCTSKKVIKSKRYRLFVKWLGMGLFTAEHELWRKHRNIVQPAFHFKILEQFIDTFNSVTDVFIEKLSENLNKDFDIFHYVNLCALDIIAETALGVPLNAQTDSLSKYVQCVQEELRIIATRSFSPLKVHDWIFRFTEDFHKEEDALRTLKGYTNSIIEKKQAALNGNAIKATDPDKKKRLAYLDLLLENRGEMSDEDISNSVEGFMFAGHDTAGLSMACTLYLLANHPEVQRKAYEELKEMFGDSDREPNSKDIQEMKYLEMVIKESLRLYPPAPIISKQLLEDYEFNGYTLPKGMNALVMIHSIHRREKYFPNPHKFNPERFSSENQANIQPFSYLPFGAGPRNCVGQKFAMIEMKVVVSKVLRRYELHPVPGFQMNLIPQIVQKPKDGIYVRVTERV